MAITSIKTGSSFTNLIKYNDFLGPNPGYDPAATFLIQRVAGTGSSGTITFNSIPSTYKHLQIRYRARTSAAGESILMQVNSDTGANYTRHRLGGEGSFAFAAGQASATAFYVGDTRTGTDTTFFEVNIIDIIDYASTTKNKTERHFQGMDRNGSGSLTLASGVWMNTSAINTLSIYVTAGNFTTDSTFALYGMVG
jgi:hypothetical protein